MSSTESLEYGESPEAYMRCEGTVEWLTELICYVCKKKVPTTIVGNGHHSSKLTQMPDGWFCDRGLCDTSATTCSIECARALSADPYSLEHDPRG